MKHLFAVLLCGMMFASVGCAKRQQPLSESQSGGGVAGVKTAQALSETFDCVDGTLTALDGTFKVELTKNGESFEIDCKKVDYH